MAAPSVTEKELEEALAASEAREREWRGLVERLRRLLSTAREAKNGTALAHDGEELFGLVIDHHVYNECGAIIGSILYPPRLPDAPAPETGETR